jgi:hypothetical protein
MQKMDHYDEDDDDHDDEWNVADKKIKMTNLFEKSSFLIAVLFCMLTDNSMCQINTFLHFFKYLFVCLNKKCLHFQFKIAVFQLLKCERSFHFEYQHALMKTNSELSIAHSENWNPIFNVKTIWIIEELFSCESSLGHFYTVYTKIVIWTSKLEKTFLMFEICIWNCNFNNSITWENFLDNWNLYTVY